MVDVKSRKCRTKSCGKRSSFGIAGTKTGQYCAQHAPEETVDVKRRKSRTECCGKLASFRVAGTKTGEYCGQHAPEGMVDVKSRKCGKVGPHHSGKKTIANVIPSAAKHASTRPPPKTSQPSGASRDFRNRVRHPEITSTASKRAVAR